MASQQPYESELFGDVAAAGGKLTRFGYEWRERTYGHVAVKIEWDDKGNSSLAAEPVTTIDHPIFKERYVSSQTVSWFKLKLGEYFTQLRFRESASGTRITARSFQTNMRRSLWYGSAEGTERTATAPPEFYIHTIHGSHQGGVCWNLGAYFVPLSLRVTTIREVWVVDSRFIGSQACNRESKYYCYCSTGAIHAIVVSSKVLRFSIR